MKQLKKALHISIPKPCSENWEKMEQREKGRFCSSCQKEVIDFSSLGDKELYQYFANAKTIPCGRFHRSQLNTAIVPKEMKSNSWNQIYKKVAAVLAFLSLKPSSSVAQGSPQTVIQPIVGKQNSINSAKEIAISGTVKNANGEIIEGAEILFNDKVVTKSDKEGKFHFEIKPELISQSSILSVTYPGMIRVARSYHPSMQSTSYNIVLEKPEYYRSVTMGSPIISGLITPFTLNLPPEGLNNDLRQRLSRIADTLRYNPTIKVELVGYGGTKKEITIAKENTEALKAYFSNREGIAEDRIILKIKPKDKTRKIGIVDIIEHNPYGE